MRRKKEKTIDSDLVSKIYALTKQGASYIEALIEIRDECENKDMYDFVECIPDNIIEEIKKEFVEKRMIKDPKIQEQVDIKNRIENILEWLE